MAVMNGKRKRHAADDGSDSHNSDDEATIRARFQKAFEAQFKPLKSQGVLPQAANIAVPGANEEIVDDDSEWSGLSGDEAEEDKTIVVVNHANDYSNDPEILAAEKKAFMSSKPPSSTPHAPQASKKSQDKDPDSDDEHSAANLKNDLALQRLLKESHLLAPRPGTNGPSSSTATLQTKAQRTAALDIRLRALGAKTSIAGPDANMPMAIRRGINEKAGRREEGRRKDAKETGVVLERFGGGTGQRGTGMRGRGRGRERDLGGPGVGKLRGATLRLKERDVRAITRGGERGGRRGGRRGG